MAKSKLILRFNQTLNAFGNSPKTGDWIGINLDDGNPDTTAILIHEARSINRTVKGLYLSNANTVKGLTQAIVSKFRADWSNTGGSQNVIFTYSESTDGNFYRQMEVELQNELWTFGDIVGGALDNGKVEVVSLVNAPPPTPKTLTLSLEGTANCANETIAYDAVITGGTSPYTIKNTADGNIQSNGNSVINLKRGIPVTISVIDSLGVSIDSQSFTPPIKLEPSHFSISVTQDGLSPIAVVSENVVLPTVIYPIQYSLDNFNFSASGNFPNLNYEQTYTVYIKDKYNCTVEKTFVTPANIDGIETLPEVETRYAKISNAGTLAFVECVELGTEVKKNYSNTLSRGEIQLNRYQYVHEFAPSDLIVQQFKSSYSLNKVTIWSNGLFLEIDPTLQSENLRNVEKVDAKLFRDVNGGLGIYFRNGNTYIQGTETVNGSSDYDEINLPQWAVAGQQISVDGIGAVSIKRIATDTTRGLYIQTGSSYGSLTDDNGKVEASFNVQDYNTYEFGFFMSSMPEEFRIVIEMGFNDLVERTFKSELIRRVDDDCDKYLFSWSDPENKAGIVHQTGIKHYARLYANLVFKSNSEGSTYRGDNETFNLEQDVYRTAELKIAVQGHLMEEKLHLAAGMEDFFINGINYRKQKMESEIVEGTNYRIITATFETGGNELEVNRQELVLKEPLTSLTGKVGIPNTIPNLLGIGNDGLLLNGSGGGVIVNS